MWASLPTQKRESQMAVFRVQLADGEKRLKTDLKAPNEDEARSAAAKYFDGARWRIVEVRTLGE
jgi:hypothetical protein